MRGRGGGGQKGGAHPGGILVLKIITRYSFRAQRWKRKVGPLLVAFVLYVVPSQFYDIRGGTLGILLARSIRIYTFRESWRNTIAV